MCYDSNQYFKGGKEKMEYEINYDTQILLPIGKEKAKIVEDDCEYRVDNSCLQVLEHSCEYFGSSLQGRKDGTKKLLGITHKAPIIVEESRKIIFFPTTSPEKEECIWINLDKIDKYYKKTNKTSEILFKNGDKVEFDVSIGSLTNQILRATRLKFILEERINKKDN